MGLLSSVSNLTQTTKALGALISDGPKVYVHDTYDVGLQNLVVLAQPNRKLEFRGYLNSDLPFSLESRWSDSAYGNINETQVFKLIDGIAQNAGGRSIQTPFWQRKLWGGTSAMQFTVNCVLVAMTDAKTEVYDQVVALCNMLLPRVNRDATPDNNLEKLSSAFENVFEFMVVPGPGPLDPSGGNDSGDAVSIKIGNTVDLVSCYLTNVKGSFSRSLDSNGYPLACSLDISVSAIDNALYQVGGKDEVGEKERNNVFKHAFNTSAIGRDLVSNVGKLFGSGSKAVTDALKTSTGSATSALNSLTSETVETPAIIDASNLSPGNAPEQ